MDQVPFALNAAGVKPGVRSLGQTRTGQDGPGQARTDGTDRDRSGQTATDRDRGRRGWFHLHMLRFPLLTSTVRKR